MEARSRIKPLSNLQSHQAADNPDSRAYWLLLYQAFGILWFCTQQRIYCVLLAFFFRLIFNSCHLLPKVIPLLQRMLQVVLTRLQVIRCYQLDWHFHVMKKPLLCCAGCWLAFARSMRWDCTELESTRENMSTIMSNSCLMPLMPCVWRLLWTIAT